VRYSLSGSTGLTWPQIRDAAQLGEELGFDGFFAADHLMAVAGFDEDAGLLDAASLLLALAPVTTTLRLGAMVSPITIRHPVVLARAMQTLDLISEGRAEVGVGAGWSRAEHETFGLPFPPASRRLELLEDACRTLVALWESPDPAYKEGDFPLRGARLSPRPVQPLIPLLVAGASDHAVRIAAQWGRAWNATGSPAFLGERVGLLRAEEANAARPGTVEITATVRFELCETDREREAKERAVRAAPRARYAQRAALLPGEDPVAALYIGPLQGLGGYMTTLEDVGVQRALISIPRPWDPEQLRRVASAIGLPGGTAQAG
jgi:alkanesulfonate monooxygenase SsuD/methylene tetrahydromethanopterin reductase-like flavin-dependent oxidoreductase (luciferase family)